MAKKDKKDKSKKLKNEAVVEAAAPEVEESEEAPVKEDAVVVSEETGEVIETTPSKGGSGETSTEVLAEPKAKRAAKRIEIPESSLEFIADFPVEDIIPREVNTRFHTKETETVLAQMIQKFGWVQPLTLDAEHRIVDGQYRLELAKKWKLKTVPVLISSGVSADAGTTDIFHMLSDRIVEWDKWNFPGTDAVLKAVDGGLATEEILGFETTSEAGELRDLARGIGWFVEVIPKTLSGSTVTLETLAGLLKKSLAGKYHYDPAQLLYIEALREQLEETRREMVASGETAGGVKPKLEQHLNEEARKLAEGEAIAEENGYKMEESEDGKTQVFTADAELAYVVNKVAEAEEAARVQIRSARDMESRFRPMADDKKLGLGQFRILASYFTDLTDEEAKDFFNSTATDQYNAFVDSVLEENRTVSANRSKNFPLTEAEFVAEQRRLKAEDAQKASDKSKKDEPKGLASLLVDDLKAKLKAEGLPTGGKKADLVARLEEAGYGADGTKGETPVTEAEEAEATADAAETVEVDEDELVEDFDDAPMVFTADSTEETSTEEESDVVEGSKVLVVQDEAADFIANNDEENGSKKLSGVVSEIAELARSAGSKIVNIPSNHSDSKALKKRGKELKALAEERELTKAEAKELKAIKKQLKAAKG